MSPLRPCAGGYNQRSMRADLDEAVLGEVSVGAFPSWFTRRTALALGLVQVLAGLAGLWVSARWYAGVERMIDVQGVVVAATVAHGLTRTSAEQTLTIAAAHRGIPYVTRITLRVRPDDPVRVGKTWRCTLVPGQPDSLRSGTVSMHRTAPLAGLVAGGFFALLGLGFLFSVVVRP